MSGNERTPRESLAHLLGGETLARGEADALFERLLTGGLDEAQIGALLALLAQRGPTADELAGAAAAMRRHVEPVPFVPAADEALIDTCGTGGAPKTFNVSTAAAIAAAAVEPPRGRGVRRVVVAKHGNRSRTGRGSAEVLAALGVNIEATPAVQAACLREVGVCFCFAIRHHPAMRFAAGPRASLGFRTVFNVLGPLTNPARAERQVIGVYDAALVPLVGEALATLGAKRAMVAHGPEGLDELGLAGPSLVAEVIDGTVRTRTIDPAAFGLEPASASAMRAADVEDSAAIIRGVLAGEPGPRRDIVLLNAAAAVVVAGAAADLAEGFALAGDAIDSGRAGDALARLAARSHAGA